eukprot:CAMPEP_0185767780 /NCGR_PEP_ID=MMETSP1174-20130828/45549_1 /TAXON_ID=35687 /ORGANISM="Dictyocha speculum, Strain CCMP1381" /LENGTH=728 /DNA_ID=CAMNT_0028452125 /DNA_START=11 /DNA_END=2197 /DNA_ORIENTATION=-
MIGDRLVEPCRLLKWFPGRRAYQLGADRVMIRKEASLEALKNWLLAHTESGAITRQEAVSMLPPIVLQVEPNHKVLDMCAAPGSKTSQILEVIQSSTDSSGEPTGLIVANDSDTQRAYMLCHQCKRLNSPALMVVTHLGQYLPDLTQAPHQKGVTRTVEGMFDRVLCDVPCSGDGTLRKQAGIWSSWSSDSGISLHPLQVQIAMRGVRLTAVGGLMVYSTCSLNPIEDEAVIATILERCRGAVELVDIDGVIPREHLKRRAGKSTWHFFEEGRHGKKKSNKKRNAGGSAKNSPESDPTPAPEAEKEPTPVPETAKEDLPPVVAAAVAAGLRYYPSFDDVPANFHGRVRQGMFPPTEEKAKLMHLERCIRCVPHDEDTGGFFVALLRKVRPMPHPNDADASTRQFFAPTHGTLAAKNCTVETPEEVKSEAAEGKVKMDVAGEPNEVKVTKDETAEVGGDSSLSAAADGAATKRGRPAEVEPEKPNKKERKDHRNSVLDEYYRPLKTDIWVEIKDYYGLPDHFPQKQLYSRSTENPKTVTLVTSTILREIMEKDTNNQLKIVSTGLKVFERNSPKAGAACHYRILQEGAHLLEPYITKRKIIVPPEELRHFLDAGIVYFSTLTNETFRQSLSAMEIGAVMLVAKCDKPNEANANSTRARSKLVIIVWRGRGEKCNTLCSKDSLHAVEEELKMMGCDVRPASTTSAAVVTGEASSACEASHPLTGKEGDTT